MIKCKGHIFLEKRNQILIMRTTLNNIERDKEEKKRDANQKESKNKIS